MINHRNSRAGHWQFTQDEIYAIGAIGCVLFAALVALLAWPLHALFSLGWGWSYAASLGIIVSVPVVIDAVGRARRFFLRMRRDRKGHGPVFDGPFLLLLIFFMPAMGLRYYPLFSLSVILLLVAMALKKPAWKWKILGALVGYLAAVGAFMWWVVLRS